MNEHRFFSINENDIKGSVFISEALDSEAKDTVWHRLVIAADLAETGSMTVSVCASNIKEQPSRWQKNYNNPEDIPLFEYTGRYLWVKIQFTADVRRFRARIYYPANSFVRYLPAIYQDTGVDSFFSRFIALFQNIYLDIDELIMQFPKFLDPAATDENYLKLLYDWLSCEEYYLLPKEKRGEFLLNCTRFYKNLGTKQCIVDFIQWLCHQTPLIVEYFDYEEYIKQNRVKSLYGEKPLLFTVILDGDKLDKAIVPLIKPLLDKFKPVYTECRLVILERAIVLDEFSYLGINSYI